MKREIEEAKKSSPYRSLILLEGKNLIQDALQNGFHPKSILFSRLNLLAELSLDKTKRSDLVQIPYRNIEVWSNLKTSPGIMATFDFEEIQQKSFEAENNLPITVILDNVRSPDNVGALVRVAAAVGCKKLITTKV